MARKSVIILLWGLNILLRFWGIWFPQEGFDEGQNIQGAQLIMNFLKGEFSSQIVTIYGFLGKILSFAPYHLGNLIGDSINFSYDIPFGLILMRFFISFIPSILTILYTCKLSNILSKSTDNKALILSLFAISFKHIETAHYAVNDSLCTFLAILSLYYFLIFWRTNKNSSLLYAGALAAFASAAKIHIGILLLATMGMAQLVKQVQVFDKKKSITELWRVAQLLGSAFTLTFLIINLPYLLYFKIWIGEIWYHIIDYPFYFKGGLLTYFYFNPAYGLGIPILCIAMVGLIRIAWQKKWVNWIPIVLFACLMVFFLASSRGAIHRWAIPLTPFAVLLAFHGFLVLRKTFNKDTYYHLILAGTLILVGYFPLKESLKLVHNLAAAPTTYDKLNQLMSSLDKQEVSGRIAESSKQTFELTPLESISSAELDEKGINYLVFSDFYFQSDKPLSIGYPHIAQQLRLAEWITIRKYIEKHWHLYQTISPKYYTHWSTNIANPPPFYIYKRPD